MMKYGTRQRKRIRRWKRHRIYAQKRLTVVEFLMGAFLLFAATTATKGGGIVLLWSVMCFWAAYRDSKLIKCYRRELPDE